MAAFASTATLGGCRKSGSGSFSAQNGQGSVLVVITDRTTGQFDHVFIDITKVSLIPEGEGDPVMVFEGTERVDLLRFRDSDFLLASNSEVPAGQYQKTRLEFSRVELVPNPEGLEVALPSGKIDLNSQVAFQVSKEAPLFLKLDIDADQSISLHESGESGGGNPRWVFHPVVFLDIRAGGTRDDCFPEVAGTIASIHPPEREEDPAQLVLDLGSDRGTLRVDVGPGRAVYGPDARRVELSALGVGSQALLRGKLRGDARLEAVWVMAGEPLEARGTFQGTLAGGRFGFQAKGVDGRLDGETTSDTLVLAECGEDPLPLSLASGRQARVVGAELEGGILRAAVIELSPTRMRGEITSLNQSRREMTLGISPGVEARLRFDARTVVSLVGDGNLGLGDLATGQTVTATVEAGDDLALRIEVEPMRVEGQAWELDIRRRIFGLDSAATAGTDQPVVEFRVRVASSATVLVSSGDDLSQVDLNELRPGDQVICFGLIPDAGVFDARTVVIRR